MRKLFFGICLLGLLVNPVWAHQDGQETQVEVLARTSQSWNSGELPAYPAGEPEVTILKITIPPKTELPVHAHPVINAGVLLKGELTVITEDRQRLRLKAGEAIVEVVDTWHYGKNEGDEPAVIIVFYAGTKDRPITVKKTDKE